MDATDTRRRRQPSMDEISALVKLDREMDNATQRAYGLAHGLNNQRHVSNIENGHHEGLDSRNVIENLSMRFGFDPDDLSIMTNQLTPLLYRNIWLGETRSPEALRIAHDALKARGFR